VLLYDLLNGNVLYFSDCLFIRGWLVWTTSLEMLYSAVFCFTAGVPYGL